jgi:hypothetical protein
MLGRRLVAILAITVTTALAFAAWVVSGRVRAPIRLAGHHDIGPARGYLAPDLRERVDGLEAETTDALLRASLALTRSALHPGLGHRTSLRFDGRSRPGHCVEYAHLYATAFNRAARHRGLDARARVVRSHHPTVLGISVPYRAFRSHDWVLVHDRDGDRYVDPALADLGLGWDLRARVRGDVPR